MNQNSLRGTKVKTGDEFGIVGWWVNTNQSDPNPVIYIPNPKDRAHGLAGRLFFIYFGDTKPDQNEINFLIHEQLL